MTDEILSQWEMERDYVLGNQEALRNQYGEEYIAVVEGKVIDHDADELTLARRVYPKFKDRYVLVSNIENIVNPLPVCMDSPECSTS